MAKLPKPQFSHKVVHKYLVNGDTNNMGIPFYKPHDMLDWGNQSNKFQPFLSIWREKNWPIFINFVTWFFKFKDIYHHHLES